MQTYRNFPFLQKAKNLVFYSKPGSHIHTNPCEENCIIYDLHPCIRKREVAMIYK
jgi:hypothetical protein